MINILEPILTFIFVLSVISLLRFSLNFFKALRVNPPKPFKFEKYETLIYGIFLSYIITYLINI